MNKYLILLIVIVVLIASGVGYRKFLLPESQRPVSTGRTLSVTVTIPKNSWTFLPETIDADLGDTLILTFVNEDDYDHGVGIDSYGVSQRIPARKTLVVTPFVVTKAGDFQFYCSVSCGQGIAASGPHQGKMRSHFDQIGTICVHKVPGDRECMNNVTPVIPSGEATTTTMTMIDHNMSSGVN